MKETIKHYFPLILTVLSAICAIQIFFHGSGNSQNGIFTDIGTYFSNGMQKNNFTSVAGQVESQKQTPLPTPKYVGNTRIVGEANTFEELFVLQFSDGTLSTIDESATAALYLLDIKNSNDTSVLTKLRSADIDNLEEVPSSVIYDTEKQLLYFHQGGIYKLYIRLYFDHRPGVLYECQIPVEVG